jgi:type VI secretion system protein ImpG
LSIPQEEITAVHSLVSPTPCFWPSAAQNASWRWLSHLKPNLHTLNGGEIGAHALAEMLKNYDFTCHSGHKDSCLEGLLHLTSKVVVDFAPAESGKRAPNELYRGLEVELKVDDTFVTGTGHLFLFGSILDHFLSLYCTRLNFIQLSIETQSGKRYTWQPRLGIKPQI